MFFSSEISFKNLAMEKVSSPFVNNVWRACTVVSLVTAVLLLTYLNQGSRDYIRNPHDAMPSVSISSIHIFPSSSTQSPPDSSVVEKNAILEHLSTITENETLNDPLATEKNETLKALSSNEKNETIEDSPEFKNETLGDSPQVENETLKDDDRIATGDNSAKGDDNYCDLFDGRWVHDTTHSPMYNATDCPFLSDQVDCRRNGRPDFNYERWNWVGNRCEIPRMNRTDMLERLRGKRVIIVGDSLNRNMFESFVCLLYSAIPSSDSYVDVKNGLKIFRIKSYGLSVEFYWAPFLVKREQEGKEGTTILTIDQMNPSSKEWRGADIMIFNTGHWWRLERWDAIRYKGEMIKSMKFELAFQKAMKTWSRWVDRNVNPSQTTVFFRSVSPEHLGKNWCFEHTEPLMDESYIETFPRSIREIVESSIGSMRTPVRYLNITKLAEYRIDAHPKVYTIKYGVLLTMEQRKQPRRYADCGHWCLPGVPDTWNRLVYASLVLDGFGANSTSLKPTVSSR